MIRPFTCICLVLAAASGLYLYQTKHRTLVLDRRIDAILGQIAQARAATVVLQAHYAELSRPDRLNALSQRLLPLRPTTPDQFVSLASLDQHLPPVEVFARPGDMPVPVAAPAPSPEQAIAEVAATALPGDTGTLAPDVPMPAQVPAQVPVPVPVPVSFPVRHPARASPARALPRALALATHPLPAPLAGHQSPAATYVAYVPARRQAAALIRAALPPSRAAATTGSMLGGSSALYVAPPVPAPN